MIKTTSRGHKKEHNKWIWLLLSLGALILATWLRFHNASFGQVFKIDTILICIEILSFGLLNFAITRLLNLTFTEKKLHYRIAFLSTLGIGLVLLIVTAQNQIAVSAIRYLPMVILAGFLGGFFASNLVKGFWENNAPPSPEIEKDVLLLHQNLMSSPIKPFFKRFLDILLSLISLVLSSPIWLVVTFLIWWEDPGPVLFVKNSVGIGGRNFKQLKFRSMVMDAEKTTGPISGYENDERVLFFGLILRKTALDELPQLVNILIGDMSYVGPRPQRTVLVHGYLQNLPQYANRHRVRPGLAGLAQVTDSYYITPEEKLAWDLEYINRANAWFDLKLVLAAFFLVFALRWHPETQPEETIRKLLRIEKPKTPIHQ